MQIIHLKFPYGTNKYMFAYCIGRNWYYLNWDKSGNTSNCRITVNKKEVLYHSD
jgi:hypothetical protein